MEDNILNELTEKTSVQSVRNSSSRRTVSKTNSTSVVTKRISKAKQSKTEVHGDVTSQSEVLMGAKESIKNVPYVQGKSNEGIEVTNHATSAYLLSKSAGDWWNVFPKTDYTYSRFSVCRQELAPGVWAMPNMSRPAIHSTSTSALSSDYASSSSSSYAHAHERSNSWSAEESARVFRRTHDQQRRSEVRSNSLMSNSRSESLTSSLRSTTIINRIYSFFWRIISSTVTIITSFFSSYHDEAESIVVGGEGRGRNVNWLSKWYYKSIVYFLELDSWILSLFHRSSVYENVTNQSSNRRKYFLFLLPPLLYAGLLLASGFNAPSAAVSSYAAWLGAQPSLWWSAVAPLFRFGGAAERAAETTVGAREATVGALGGGSCGAPGGEAVDLEILVQRLLATPQLSALVAHGSWQQENDATTEESASTEHARLLAEHQHVHDRLAMENSAMRSHIEALEEQMRLLKARVAPAPGCCRVRVGGLSGGSMAHQEEHIASFLARLLEAEGTEGLETASGVERLRIALEAFRAAGSELEQRLEEKMEKRLEERLEQRLEERKEQKERVDQATIDVIMSAVSDMVQREIHMWKSTKIREGEGTQLSVNGSLSLAQVRKIVKDAINLYDADKTGLVDYALESAGGTVINIRCTENYNDRSLALAFLGLILPWSNNHPRIALQPDVHPGQCWAFRGAQGWLVVRLSRRVQISSFSIEHIPAAISSAGNIDAAPKNFSVLGLDHEDDMEPVLLGKYMYTNPGPSLQFFPVQNENAPAYQIVELAIESNHGNLEYTCLYRFRVHGVAV